MKKLILIIAVVIGLSSCEKEVYLPNNSSSQNTNSVDTPMYNYNLDWSSNQLGINIKDLKPSGITKLSNYNSSTREKIIYGELVSFYNADSTILLQFVMNYQNGLTSGMGRINGKTFILNIENSTINICNSYQNVAVVFDLFSGEEDIDS
jgi:hypothetical protein